MGRDLEAASGSQEVPTRTSCDTLTFRGCTASFFAMFVLILPSRKSIVNNMPDLLLGSNRNVADGAS